jgi:hypothetical protein
MAIQEPYRGSCLCGAIQYEVDIIEPRMAHCHCTMCRKFHGAAFASFAEAKADNFRWLQGEEQLLAYTGNNNSIRRFCKTCGSSMTFQPSFDNGGLIEFTLGTLDSDINDKPDAHIFLNYKANWYDAHDELPKYAEGRIES